MEEKLPIFSEGLTNNEKYAKYTSDRMLEEYLNSANHTWAASSQFIKYALHDGYDFIIEGYQILPEFVYKEFANDSRIVPIFITKTDEQKIYDGVKLSEDKNDRLKNKCSDETIVKISKMIAKFGKIFEGSAKEYGYMYKSTQDDFFGSLDEVVKLAKNIYETKY